MNFIIKGESNNELPVTISIKYELNGKEVNPNDVLGQVR